MAPVRPSVVFIEIYGHGSMKSQSYLASWYSPCVCFVGWRFKFSMRGWEASRSVFCMRGWVALHFGWCTHGWVTLRFGLSIHGRTASHLKYEQFWNWFLSICHRARWFHFWIWVLARPDLGFSMASCATTMGRDIFFPEVIKSKYPWSSYSTEIPLPFEFIIRVPSCSELKNSRSSCSTGITLLFESMTWVPSYSKLKDPKRSCSNRSPLVIWIQN